MAASTLASSVQSKLEKKQPKTSGRSEVAFAAAAILIFPTALGIWLALDYSYPMWDAASHVHDSIQYEKLFRHPRLFNSNWIKEFLTVNPAYPLTIHAINGLFKAVFGIGRFTEAISLVAFSFVLNASVYATAKILLRDKWTAASTILAVNCYPVVSLLSHSPMLDFPQLSLCCVAILTLVWWQELPSYGRAIAAGIALGLASSSKQTAALYLVGPCAYLFLASLVQKRFSHTKQLALSGLITACFIGLWIFPNLAGLKKYMDYNGSMCQTNRTIVEIFSSALVAYGNGIQGSMSTFLLTATLFALLYLALNHRDSLRKLLLPAISAVTGILLMSLQTCNNPEPRYIVPAFLFTALVTGATFGHCIKSRLGKVLACTIAAIAAAQFVLFNYSPYPIRLSAKQTEQVRMLVGHPTVPGKMEPAYNPTRNTDMWRQAWCIKQIVDSTPNPTALNILPSTPELSPHTMNLAAIYEGARIECSTFRQYTLRGDIVRYDEAAINSYPWHLIKTGFQGFALKNKESESNYNKMIEYIEKSGNFRQVAQTSLPDHSELKLFKRN